MTLELQQFKTVFIGWARSIDRMTLFSVLILIVIGLMLSMAASPAAANRLDLSNSFYFFYRHAVYAFISVIILLFVSMLNRKNAFRLAFLLLIASLTLMIITIFLGYEVKGAQRWLRLGSLSIQPSEFLKPAFIVSVSWMLALARKDSQFPGSILAFILYLFTVLLLAMQPDIGQTILITITLSVLFFCAGLSWRWIVLLVFLVGIGSGLIFVNFSHVSSRIESFLNPGQNDTYQIDKATEAISTGGLLGQGPGEGQIKHQLPDAHTDFIFSVAAEEFGLIASLTLIGMVAFLVYRGFTGALRQSDLQAQLAAAGLTALFGLQASINFAVNLGMIPPKGMTLPFISYGGSSLISLAFTGGFLLVFTRK